MDGFDFGRWLDKCIYSASLLLRKHHPILIKNAAAASEQYRAGSLPRPHRGLFKGALQQWLPVFVVANLIDYPVPSPSSPSLPSSHKLVYLSVEEAKLAAWHSRGQTAVWVCAQQASSIKHGNGRIVGVCSLPCTDWYWCVWTWEEVNVGQSYRRSKRRKRRNYWMAVTQLIRVQLHSWIAYMYVCIYIVFFVWYLMCYFWWIKFKFQGCVFVFSFAVPYIHCCSRLFRFLTVMLPQWQVNVKREPLKGKSLASETGLLFWEILLNSSSKENSLVAAFKQPLVNEFGLNWRLLLTDLRLSSIMGLASFNMSNHNLFFGFFF